MSEKFKTSWFFASLEIYKKEVGGILNRRTEEFYSERSVDLEDFAKRLQEHYEQYDAAGYEVINVIPISMGQSEPCLQSNKNYVGDVGFSITRGAVIVGKKKP